MQKAEISIKMLGKIKKIGVAFKQRLYAWKFENSIFTNFPS